jgi:putative tricarboxylic transport membrane protein
MQATRAKGVLVGGLMLVAGLGYLYLTVTLPQRDRTGAAIVDASFIPYILAVLMVGLGILQMIAGLRTPRSGTAAWRDPEADAEEGVASYWTVAVTLGLVAAYAALLRPLGFPLVTALYLFLQFIVLTPNDRRASYPLYGVLAIIASIVIFVTFRYGFELLLPAGPLTSFLP